jgi:murein DD-endopeptidase MepM/ murein hydrolase activator NlpD
MNESNVNRGQKVKRGDVIGYEGSRSRSTDTHLHYEIIIKNKKFNLLIFLN